MLHQLLVEVFQAPAPAETLTGEEPGRHLEGFTEGPGIAEPDVPAHDIRPGQALGRFRVEAEVGRGGFGVVYRATDTRLRRTVALKVPRPDRVQTVALWDRFAREARLAAGLAHEAIVPVIDAGILDGVFVLVSAFQEGEPLSEWLAERHPAGMPPRTAAALARRLAAGLRHAHERGVLHRDLKPANVLMVPAPQTPEGWCPRITDFGLGTSQEEADGSTLTGFWLGSPPYMAPEQVLAGVGRVDARSDVYGLGAILYEMLTGRPVYPCRSLVDLSLHLGRGEPPIRPRQLRGGIPRDLETIVLTCLERDPGRRYASAAALEDDLARFLDGRPILARPLPPWERAWRWARRTPSQAALVGLALAASVTVAGLIAWHARQLGEKNVELSRSNQDLATIVGQLEATNARLRASEEVARRTAFAADLQLADREVRAGRFEVAQTILRRHATRPGTADLRDFAWHRLWREATRTHEVSPLFDLSWWRGPEPSAHARDLLVRSGPLPLGAVVGGMTFDGDRLRVNSPGATALFDGRYRHFVCDEGGRRLAHLRFETEVGGWSLPLSADRCVLGPDGRTLVLSDRAWKTSPDEAPPPVRLETASLPGPVRAAGIDRVVTVPASHDVVFSGDGRTIACLAASGEHWGISWRPLFYDLASDRRASYGALQTAVSFHLSAPAASWYTARLIRTRQALSHDGRLAARTGHEPRIVVFETRTGRTLWSLDRAAFGPTAWPTALAFAPGGGALITGDTDGRVRAWDAATGRLIGRCPLDLTPIETVSFYPDERTVAIVLSGEDAIRFWRYSPDPEPPATLDTGDEVWGLAFTDAGRALVAAGDDDRATAWDVATGRLVGTMPGGVLQSALAASLDGRRVAVGGYDGLVRLRRGDLAPDGETTFRELAGTRLRSIAFSPDGRRLVAGGHAPRVLLVDGLDAQPSPRIVETPHQDIYALAFSPDGRTLAMGSHLRLSTLWDVSPFRLRAKLEAPKDVGCLAFAPDGATLIAGDIEGGLHVWDMPSGRLRTSIPRASESCGVWALAFSPDGRTLATGGDDGLVRLWDPALFLERATLPGHRAKLHALAFSPTGKVLASGDFNGAIRLWRAADQKVEAGPGPTP